MFEIHRNVGTLYFICKANSIVTNTIWGKCQQNITSFHLLNVIILDSVVYPVAAWKWNFAMQYRRQRGDCRKSCRVILQVLKE